VRLNVQYFAILKQKSEKSAESLETSAKTGIELYRELQGRYQFGLKENQLKLAINDEFVPFETPLKEGDTVVFIPPVAGG
jgi:molybdopterin converting factor subunit 1